jgi:hypothetical protein
LNVSHRVGFVAAQFSATTGAAVFVVKSDDEDIATPEFPSPIVRTILFVDDDDVSQRPGTVRSLHPPARYGAPVLVGDQPWEEDVLNQSQLLYNTVVQEEDGTFKVWYNSYPALDGKESLVGLVCYAESADGLTWVKPSLGLVSWNGSTDNNIVVAAPNLYGAAAVVDRDASSPQERYKLLIWSQSGYGTHPPKLNVPGMYGFTSADGKAFDPVSKGSALLIGGGVIGWEVPFGGTKQPVLCDYGKNGPYPTPPGSSAERDCYGNPSSISDVMQLFFDQSINEFVVHHKIWADGPDGRQSWRRALGRTQTVSRNFSHWRQPELVLSPDEHDEPSGGIRLPVASGGDGARVDLHGGSVWQHPRSGHYMLALMVYFFNNDEYTDPHSCKDCFTNLANEFVTSRDGIAWERRYRSSLGAPLWAGIPSRANDTAWDARWYMATAGPISVAPNGSHGIDDEVRFYYNGYSDGSGPKHVAAIGFASMQRDRYVSLADGGTWGGDGGQVTLRPLMLNRSTITLNVEVLEESGYASVEVLSEDSWRVRGFSREKFVNITSGGLDTGLGWRDRGGGGQVRSLSELSEGLYRLRIYLFHARLYAVDFRGGRPLAASPALKLDDTVIDVIAMMRNTSVLGVTAPTVPLNYRGCYKGFPWVGCTLDKSRPPGR